jgi:hypothetical protein
MLTRIWVEYGQSVAHRGRMLWFLMVLAALLWGVLRPEGPHEPFPFFAVGLHVLAFLALGLSARFAFQGVSAVWVWVPLLVAAVGLELLQAVLQPDSRQFSVLDIVGNIVGVVLAMGLGVRPWFFASKGV